MTSQNPNYHADQRHSKSHGTTPQGVAPTKSSRPETQPIIQDSPKGGLFDRNQLEVKEFWDPKTAAFTSPYYDPFGEDEVEEVKVVSPGDDEGNATTVEAYNADGSRR